MKKLSYGLVGLLLLLAAIGWSLMTFAPHKLVPFILNQQLKMQNSAPDYHSNKDAITVVTVGTSSPIPGDRAQTGTAVMVNGHFFMFDVGPGVVKKSETFQLPLDKLDAVFITHWHSDHFMDLPNLINRSWVLGRNTDLHLYGPDGLDTLNQAINQLLHIENRHRVDHHGEIMDISKASAIPHEFQNIQRGKTIVYQQDGITITAFDVSHEPIEPAVGYAIEYNGKKVVISGDTKRDELVQEMATDADLLIHEVMLMSLLEKTSAALLESGNTRNAKILRDVLDYHTSPSDVAALAQAAGVKKLALHHFAPAPDLKVVENLYRQEMKAYDGELHFANDGDVFVVQ